MSANDLFARITGQIADAIAAGASTYHMPWHRWGNNLSQPVNAFSGRNYRGVNVLLLWAAAEQAGYATGRWATFRQWKEAGAQVRKGERGTSIFFWKAAAKADEEPDSDDAKPGRPRYIAKVYWLFNEAQVDGAEPAIPQPNLSAEERIAVADAFVASTGASISHGGDKACFVPSLDQIRMPEFEQFRSPEAFYAVVFHELIHWSGAKHRLDRDLTSRFDRASYAMEELVAELGSAFLSAQLGLAPEPRPDHAGYVASWLRVLEHDGRAILTASAKAQEAVDYLLELGATARGATTPQGKQAA
jgi:antirestriction protein ArdC